MTKLAQRFSVKVGLGKLDQMMTKDQAKRYGDRNMPSDLKRAGFETVIFEADPELFGAVFLRINYGKKMPSMKSPTRHAA